MHTQNKLLGTKMKMNINTTSLILFTVKKNNNNNGVIEQEKIKRYITNERKKNLYFLKRNYVLKLHI